MKNQKTVEKQPEQCPASPPSVPRKELSTSGEGEITHPFAEVPDAMYAPPMNWNYAQEVHNYKVRDTRRGGMGGLQRLKLFFPDDLRIV